MSARVLAAAALLGAALAVPARADLAASHALTVTGTRTAYTTLRVTEPVTFDYADAVVVRAGRYGGVAFGPGFALSSDDVPTTVRGGGHPVAFFRDWTLYPGTYRVYLISDGQPVTVRLPWSGPKTDLRAATPVDHELRIEHRTVADGRWQVAIPQAGAGPSDVNGLALYEGRDPRDHAVAVRTCVSRGTTCDGSRIGLRATGSVSVGGIGAGAGVMVEDPRRWNVLGEVRGASALGTLTVLSLRFGLGPGLPVRDPRRWAGPL